MSRPTSPRPTLPRAKLPSRRGASLATATPWTFFEGVGGHNFQIHDDKDEVKAVTGSFTGSPRLAGSRAVSLFCIFSLPLISIKDERVSRSPFCLT